MYITKSLQMSDQSLNTKVFQGRPSVSTRLRCDGIFNDQFIK